MGELSVNDIRPNVEAAGFTPGIVQDVALSIATRVALNMNGQDLATVGVSIPDTTSFPNGQIVVDTAVLNYGSNTPQSFPQVAVTVGLNSHMGYAYIDSDFDGDYDRAISLGFLG